MNTEKPLKLIALLNDLIATTDKPQIGGLYTKIAAETMRVRFVERQDEHFIGLLYKQIIRLSIRNYANDLSEESKNDVKEAIGFLEGALIFA